MRPLVYSNFKFSRWASPSFYRLIPRIISAGNTTIKGPHTREWVYMSTWLDTLPELSFSTVSGPDKGDVLIVLKQRYVCRLSWLPVKVFFYADSFKGFDCRVFQVATKRAKYLQDIWYPLKNHSKKPISAHWHCKTATSSSMEISNYFSLQNYQGKLKNRQIWYTVPLKTLKTKYAVKPIFKSEHLNRPLTKPGSDCLDRIGSDYGSDRTGSSP